MATSVQPAAGTMTGAEACAGIIAGNPAGSESEDVGASDFAALLEAGVLMPATMVWSTVLPEAQAGSSAVALQSSDHTTTSEAEPLPTMPTLVTAENATGAAPVETKNLKRNQFGLGVSAETFPDGWEALLADAPASNETQATNAEPASQMLPQTSENNPDMADSIQLSTPKALGMGKTSEVKSDHALVAKAQAASSETESVSLSPAKSVISPETDNPATTDASSTSRHTVSASSRLDAGSTTVVKEHGTASRTLSEVSGQEPTGNSGLGGFEVKGGSVSTSAVVDSIGSSKGLQSLNELQKQMVVKDFVQSTVHNLKGGNESLSIDLNPPELGRIKVVIETQGDHVNARLQAQDQEVGKLFRDNAESIRRSLQDAGIKVGDLSVEIRQQFQANPNEQDQLAQARLQKFFQNKLQANSQDLSQGTDLRLPTAAAWKSLGSSRLDMMV